MKISNITISNQRKFLIPSLKNRLYFILPWGIHTPSLKSQERKTPPALEMKKQFRKIDFLTQNRPVSYLSG